MPAETLSQGSRQLVVHAEQTIAYGCSTYREGCQYSPATRSRDSGGDVTRILHNIAARTVRRAHQPARSVGASGAAAIGLPGNTRCPVGCRPSSVRLFHVQRRHRDSVDRPVD